MKNVLKELLLTLLVSLTLGVVLIGVFHYSPVKFPLHPDRRLVFIVGIVLFSLSFRLLMILKEQK